MTTPELYRWYEKNEAIALLGSSSEGKRKGQWVHFPARSVCFAMLGDDASSFVSAGMFRWVTDEKYLFGDPVGFVPSEVKGGESKGRAIDLFVRSGDSEKYRYLGALSPTYRMQHASRSSHGSADFEIFPALPSAIWAEMGGFDAGNADHARVDAALSRLRGETSAEDRMAILKEVVEYWHGPMTPADGFTDAELEGIRMPAVLRNWYRWAGKRKNIIGGQNFLLSPRTAEPHEWGIYMEDDRLVFYHENQCVYKWATLPEGDDPPVFGRYEKTDPWQEEGMTLSEHLILACLFEAMMDCKYGASTAWLKEEDMAEITRHIPSIPIGPWTWCAMHFHAGQGAFMCASLNEDEDGKKCHGVWIAAKTEHPLQFLKPLLKKDWDSVSI